MSVRVVRHDRGTIVSGASYCYKSKWCAQRESIKHPEPHGVTEFVHGTKTIYLARSGEGNAVNHYGVGGHHVAISAP